MHFYAKIRDKSRPQKKRRKRRTDLFSLSCSAPLSSPSPAVVVPIRPFVPPSALSIFLIALPFFLALFWCSFLFKGFLLRVCGRGQIECCVNGPRLAGYPKIHGPFTSTSRTIPATAPKKKSDAFFGDFPLSSFFFFFLFFLFCPKSPCRMGPLRRFFLSLLRATANLDVDAGLCAFFACPCCVGVLFRLTSPTLSKKSDWSTLLWHYEKEKKIIFRPLFCPDLWTRRCA